MGDSGFVKAESVTAIGLLVVFILGIAFLRMRRSRPDFNIALPLFVGYALRLWAIAGIASTGLESTLRGGDEYTFLAEARQLAATPWGHGFWPHGVYQLQTVVFAIQMKLAHFSVGAMRITQVGIALMGALLILVSVHDLAGRRAARIAAWVLMLEPASIFFNSALHKEPLMELAAGLVVFGGTRIWRRLDIRGILICGLGGLIAIETRAYAGWFLVAASVLVLLHASLRNLDRPLRAMPLIYAVIIAGFIATPAILQASSKKNLQVLQTSQTANSLAQGTGTAGSNSDNLALEKVDFSTRGAIVRNLPKRIRDLVLKPYPWQLSDTSQRFGAIGTLIAYALLILLIRYGWIARGDALKHIAPLLYPMLFLLVAYSLSAGNAGTGFRYRTHLVTLAVGVVAILRERAAEARARKVAARAGIAGYEPSTVVERAPVAV